MSILLNELQTPNPHLANLQSKLEAKHSGLDWLVIAHDDSQMNQRLAEVVDQQSAVTLQVPQGRWESETVALQEAVMWSINKAGVKHILIVGHSQAGDAASQRSWGEGDCQAIQEPDADPACNRLLAGARRVEAQVQQAKQQYVKQISQLCRHEDLHESLSAGEIELHTLFYVAESGTFLVYSVAKQAFIPIA